MNLTAAMPLFLSSQLQKLHQQHANRQPTLMQAIGQQIANWLWQQYPQQSFCVLAGPGNNGGDALIAATHLLSFGATVSVIMSASPATPDAQAALQGYSAAGGRINHELPVFSADTVIVDGLFGVGLSRAIESPYLGWLAQINTQSALHSSRLTVVAIDCPSGLHTDTGVAQSGTLSANHTLVCLAHKPGYYTADGLDYCGQLVDLPALIPLPETTLWRSNQALLRQLLPQRHQNSHKGLYGHIGILGGSTGMLGAALLSARAALHAGAGKVSVALLADNAPTYDALQPELMFTSADALLQTSQITTLAIGPGMGQSPAAQACLRRALALPIPLVLDADALNLIASHAELAGLLHQRSAPSLLTPHPGEAARLLGQSNADIQADRLHAASQLAQQLNSLVVLKGAGSVMVLSDGQVVINHSGHAGMSAAGQGDVLSGVLAACLAQTPSSDAALLLAVGLHGRAAEWLREKGTGPIGLTASETLQAVRHMLNHPELV